MNKNKLLFLNSTGWLISCLCILYLDTPLKAADTKFSKLIEKSHVLAERTPFPTYYNRIATIAGIDRVKQLTIEQQARNAYSIMSKKVYQLVQDFLQYKRSYGTAVEKQLYHDMSEASFVERLLIKHPLMFMTGSDMYLLRNGKKGQGGFEAIGTDNEKAPLLLRDYLSYDEMQIAALIGASVPTFFINDGNRVNKGMPGAAGTFQKTGVYVGLVGARFEKQNLMEWQHMIVTPEQNTQAHGYGLTHNKSKKKLLAIWESLYDEQCVTFEQVRADTTGRFILIAANRYLDTVIYKKRMRLVLEPFLLDAHNRGKMQQKKVYVHAVGLGLGVWQIHSAQAQLMMDVYAQLIEEHNLSCITDINFSWFPAAITSCGGVKNGQKYTTAHNAIKIHFSQRNPAEKLVGSDANKLLVAMYAWDGNAYPGNEYWDGALTASGDPAAACCSTITELQNPLINAQVTSLVTF